jgi:hypothetical protein
VISTHEYYSSGEDSRVAGIDKSSICKDAVGKQERAGGYRWKKIKK